MKTFIEIKNGEIQTADGEIISNEMLAKHRHEIRGDYGWVDLPDVPKEVVLDVSDKRLRSLISLMLSSTSRNRFVCTELVKADDGYKAFFKPRFFNNTPVERVVNKDVEVISEFAERFNTLMLEKQLSVPPQIVSSFRSSHKQFIESARNLQAVTNLLGEMESNISKAEGDE